MTPTPTYKVCQPPILEGPHDTNTAQIALDEVIGQPKGAPRPWVWVQDGAAGWQWSKGGQLWLPLRSGWIMGAPLPASCGIFLRRVPGSYLYTAGTGEYSAEGVAFPALVVWWPGLEGQAPPLAMPAGGGVWTRGGPLAQRLAPTALTTSSDVQELAALDRAWLHMGIDPATSGRIAVTLNGATPSSSVYDLLLDSANTGGTIFAGWDSAAPSGKIQLKCISGTPTLYAAAGVS